jgi:hypothetical protein
MLDGVCLGIREAKEKHPTDQALMDKAESCNASSRWFPKRNVLGGVKCLESGRRNITSVF